MKNYDALFCTPMVHIVVEHKHTLKVLTFAFMKYTPYWGCMEDPSEHTSDEKEKKIQKSRSIWYSKGLLFEVIECRC